jgi:hypothetical protein
VIAIIFKKSFEKTDMEIDILCHPNHNTLHIRIVLEATQEAVYEQVRALK